MFGWKMVLLACLHKIFLLAPCAVASKVSGIYYLPSIKGLDPRSNSVDLYDPYFEPIHGRDLDLMKLTTTHVLLGGFSSNSISQSFLDLAFEKNLGVIVTISFYGYDVFGVLDNRQNIINDLLFVDSIKDHPAVVGFVLGDVLGPFLSHKGQGDIVSGKTQPEQVTIFKEILYDMVVDLRARGVQSNSTTRSSDPAFLGIHSFLFLEDEDKCTTQSDQFFELWETEDEEQKFNPITWIYDLGTQRMDYSNDVKHISHLCALRMKVNSFFFFF